MNANSPKISYWTIAALGLAWNLLGCLNFIAQSNPETVAQMPEALRTTLAQRPASATAAFAVSAFGGAVGAILLLLRRRVAVQVLMLSLGATLVTLIYVLTGTQGLPQLLSWTGLQPLVALVLLWTARLAARSGWLR